MDVVLLHGIMSAPGAHWQAWLSDVLSSRGHHVDSPALPEPDYPNRQNWLNAIRDVADQRHPEQLVLIGHSLGATSALDYIEQLDQPIKAFISVAGFERDYGSDLNGYFLRGHSVDFSKVRANVGTTFCIYGDDDPYVTKEALHQLSDDLRVTPTVVTGGGHLNTEASFTTFPYLLDIVENLT
jgi:predicted alpha/beta hydrolase family esterase